MSVFYRSACINIRNVYTGTMLYTVDAEMFVEDFISSFSLAVFIQEIKFMMNFQPKYTYNSSDSESG